MNNNNNNNDISNNNQSIFVIIINTLNNRNEIVNNINNNNYLKRDTLESNSLIDTAYHFNSTNILSTAILCYNRKQLKVRWIRYVRLRIISPATKWGVSVWRFQVWGIPLYEDTLL